MTSSLPYLGYVDEGNVLNPVIVLLKTGSWDPGSYLYPSLTYYLIALAANAARPFYAFTHGHSIFVDLPASANFYYDLVSPPELILIGRLVVMAFSIGTVAIAALLARRLGGTRAGLMAGLFVALCPALVSRGSIVIVDTIGAFFVLSALLLASHVECEPERTPGSPPGRPPLSAAYSALLGGAASGFALATKYTLATVFCAILVAIAWRPSEVREKLRLALLAGIGLAAGSVAAMPALLLRTKAVAIAILEQSRLYANPLTFDPRFHGESYIRHLISADEVGLALMSAGIAGVAWMLSHRRLRGPAFAWLAFAACLLVPLVSHPYRPMRNLLSFVAPLCIAAALLIDAGLRSRRSRLVAAAIALVVVGSMARPLFAFVKRRWSLVDTRITAVDWIASRMKPGESVLVERELAIFPSELRRITGEVRVASWREIPDVVRERRFKYVLAGAIDWLETQSQDREQNERRWESWLGSLTPEISFGVTPTPVTPFYWRYNSELIRVYPTPPQSPPGSPFSWILPGNASTRAANGYTTDLVVANTGAGSVVFALRFLSHDEDGTGAIEKRFTLATGQSMTFSNALASVFGVTEGYGAVQVRASAPTLSITGRTSINSASSEAVGQSVPAFASTDLVVAGAPRSIDSIREGTSARTNLLVANAGFAPLEVELTLLSGNGARLGSSRVSLLPLGMTQVAHVARALGVSGEVSGARLVLSTPTPHGAFAAYASVIDNATGEPNALLPR